MHGHFVHDAWFFTPNARKAHEEAGTTSYVPNHLHRAGLDRLAYQKPTVFAGTCSPPDPWATYRCPCRSPTSASCWRRPTW